MTAIGDWERADNFTNAYINKLNAPSPINEATTLLLAASDEDEDKIDFPVTGDSEVLSPNLVDASLGSDVNDDGDRIKSGLIGNRAKSDSEGSYVEFNIGPTNKVQKYFGNLARWDFFSMGKKVSLL